jgi:hypothetical protein
MHVQFPMLAVIASIALAPCAVSAMAMPKPDALPAALAAPVPAPLPEAHPVAKPLPHAQKGVVPKVGPGKPKDRPEPPSPPFKQP